MELNYYDTATGQKRMKRRYKWAMIAFAAGLAVGLLAEWAFSAL